MQKYIHHKNRNYNIPREANEVCSALYPKRFLPSSPQEHTGDVLNMGNVVITIFMVLHIKWRLVQVIQLIPPMIKLFP